MRICEAHANVLVNVSLVLYALTAGSSFLFTKEAGKELPAATLTACRLWIGSFGLLLVHTLIWGPRTTYVGVAATIQARPGIVAATSLCNTTIPYTLYAVALSHGVDVSVAAVFSGAAPLFVALGAWTVLVPRRKCSFGLVVGLLVGFAGIILVAVKKQLVHGALGNTTATGLTANAAAVLSKSAASLCAERFFRCPKGRLVDAPSMALTQTLLGAVASLCVAATWDFWLFPANGDVLPRVDWRRVLPALAYLGLACSCAVYFAQFFLIRRVGSVRQVTVDFLTPAVGVIEGALLQCDLCNVSGPVIVLAVVGSVMSVSGVILVQCMGDRPENTLDLSQEDFVDGLRRLRSDSQQHVDGSSGAAEGDAEFGRLSK